MTTKLSIIYNLVGGSMGKKYKRKVSNIFIVFFLVGILFGIGASYLITRNDCFILNGSKEIVLDINDTYSDQGVKVITFGKDMSNNVNVIIYNENDEEVDKIDTSSNNEYTIIYTVDSLKWENYKLIRRVIVGGDSNE